MGETLSTTDQNGTTHTYVYDVLGRLITDSATTTNHAVSTITVKETYSYNAQGLLFDAQTFGFSGLLTKVERLYNGFGQLTSEMQQHISPPLSPVPAYYVEPGIELGARAGGESGASWFLKIAPVGAVSNTLLSLYYLMIWRGVVSLLSRLF